MANLIDGLNRADHNKIANITAIMETCTLRVSVRLFFTHCKNIYRRISSQEPLLTGMSNWLHHNERFFCGMEDRELRTRCRDDLLAYTKNETHTRGPVSDDALSLAILKVAARVYGRKKYELMSPAEMADSLKVECEKRNPKRLIYLPIIWLWSFFLILILTPILSSFFHLWNRPFLPIIFTIIFEIVSWIAYNTKIKRENLCQVIALAGKSYDGFFSTQTNELSIREWSKEESEKFENGVRALHSIQRKLNLLIQRRTEMIALNSESDKAIQLNLSTINSTNISSSDSKMVVDELNRRIENLKAANNQLEEEKRQRNNTIAMANKQIQLYESYRCELLSLLVQIINNLWVDRYNKFTFQNEFFSTLVSSFEWPGFEVVERRLLELTKAEDPASFGRKKNQFFAFEFAIESRPCAIIYSINARKITILGLERNFDTNDVDMTDEQIVTVLSEFGIKMQDKAKEHVNDVIKKMVIQLQKGRKAISDLSDKVDNLALEKKTLSIERESLIREKDRLSKELSELQKSMQTNTSVEKEKELKNQIAELERKLLEKDSDLLNLQREYDQLLNSALHENERHIEHTEELKARIKENEETITRLEADYNSAVSTVNDLTNSLNLNLGTLEKVKENLKKQKVVNQKDKENVKKLESATKSMKQTIQEQEKRMSDILSEKDRVIKENERISEALKLVYNEISGQRQRIKELEKMNTQLEDQLNNDQLIENKDIRLAFEEVFKRATKEIDIMSPWLGKFTREDDFYELVENSLKRDVTIKILYGLKDLKDDKNFNEDTLREKYNSRKNVTSFEWAVINVIELHKHFNNSEYRNKIISKMHRSHAKLIIVDEEYYLIGSFNFLSYDGKDPDRGEIVEKSSNKQMIETLHSKFFEFTDTKPEYILRDYL